MRMRQDPAADRRDSAGLLGRGGGVKCQPPVPLSIILGRAGGYVACEGQGMAECKRNHSE